MSRGRPRSGTRGAAVVANLISKDASSDQPAPDLRTRRRTVPPEQLFTEADAGAVYRTTGVQQHRINTLGQLAASRARPSARPFGAIVLRAELHVHQPQDDVRLLLDPAGHPFCLNVDTGD